MARPNRNGIDSEVQMIADGLDGLMVRFMGFNGSNFKMLGLVKNIALTSFKLGSLLEHKKIMHQRGL